MQALGQTSYSGGPCTGQPLFALLAGHVIHREVIRTDLYIVWTGCGMVGHAGRLFETRPFIAFGPLCRRTWWTAASPQTDCFQSGAQSIHIVGVDGCVCSTPLTAHPTAPVPPQVHGASFASHRWRDFRHDGHRLPLSLPRVSCPSEKRCPSSRLRRLQ